MSDSNKEIDFLSTEDQKESEEIPSPACSRANPPEEPHQSHRVVSTGTLEETTQTAAKTTFRGRVAGTKATRRKTRSFRTTRHRFTL